MSDASRVYVGGLTNFEIKYTPDEYYSSFTKGIFNCAPKKKALIFGVSGQDGYYLTKLLLEKGYDVTGVSRPVSSRPNKGFDSFDYHYKDGDVTDFSSICRIVKEVKPDEVYNLAAQSKVSTSFDEPGHTLDATAKGVLNILEAIRAECPSAKFFQAGSSEMYGTSYSEILTVPFDDLSTVVEKYQTEKTPFEPKNPYAVAKVAGHHYTTMYREVYGIYAVSGILFNHDSPRRNEAFLTKKVCNYVHQVKNHKTRIMLELGDLSASRDWGWSEDFVKAMHLTLQQPKPEDYVIATGESHTVEEFVAEAFKVIGITNWKDYVYQTKTLNRPSDTKYSRGYIEKIKKAGWTPTVTFKDIPKLLIESIDNER